MHPRRVYTGIDKLLMAAMLEETANSHIKPLNNIPAAYLPYVRAPSNKSELELYHLLERANLLGYFETFVQFGGDDVQQLSEADEDEFIEIMGLVGMTHKPLHVRRLQKALIEWRASRNSEAQERGQQQQQYLPPREVLVGVPKRPRLMDDLHRKEEARVSRSPQRQHRRATSSPKQTRRRNTCDSDDDDDGGGDYYDDAADDESESGRLIDVLDNPQSDTELENISTTRAARGSPDSLGPSHEASSMLPSPTKRNQD